jgi:threonine synthase
MSAMGFITEGQTLAEGVRVRQPLRAGALLQMVAAGHGEFIPIDEADILSGRDELARRGLYVEPTSAITWAALDQTVKKLPDPVVVMLTGSGYKYSR